MRTIDDERGLHADMEKWLENRRRESRIPSTASAAKRVLIKIIGE